MTFHGHLQQGVIVLNEPVSLPEGTEVLVDAPVSNGTHTNASVPLWGLLADEAELLDQIVAEAMHDRCFRKIRDVEL